MKPFKFLIELSDNELQLLTENEMKALEESNLEFDGFDSHIVREIIDPISIIQLEANRMKWALYTFPEATAVSSLNKLREEANEIEQSLLNGQPDPIEYADALMCLFDSAGRAGITPLHVFEAFQEKLLINKTRTWVKNPDNTYSHVKRPSHE